LSGSRKERRKAHGAGQNLKVKQFRYSSDNLGYLIYSDQNAIAVDGGAVEDILSFLKSNNISLKYITNTHSHADHTVGNNSLLIKSDAKYIDYKTLVYKGLELDNYPINIFETPGHTSDSVILKIGDNLLTGDTLFIGKVGRCFSGDVEGFYKSIKLIMDFPDNSVIYPGHDYVLEYMEFASKFDPDNRYIDETIAGYDPDLIKSTLGFEKKLNPFLRVKIPPPEAVA
jgi:hydroxyacylglutathione hydrolase